MGRLIKILTATLLCVSMCSCSVKNSKVSGTTIVYEKYQNGKYDCQMMDNKYCYYYVNNELQKKILKTTDTVPCLYILNTNDNYILTNEAPISYVGSYRDFCAYINQLFLVGYELEYLESTSDILDIKIHKDSERIRVIWLGNNKIKILYENAGNFNTVPPYISGKEELYD